MVFATWLSPVMARPSAHPIHLLTAVVVKIWIKIVVLMVCVSEYQRNVPRLIMGSVFAMMISNVMTVTLVLKIFVLQWHVQITFSQM